MFNKQCHYRFPQQQDSHTHQHIQCLCLNQSHTNSLTDPLSVPCTIILGYKCGDSWDHSIVDQYRYLIYFGCYRISGHCHWTQRIDCTLHGKLSNTHHWHLKTHGKSDLQMRCWCTHQIWKVFSAKMKFIKLMPSSPHAKNHIKRTAAMNRSFLYIFQLFTVLQYRSGSDFCDRYLPEK